MVLSVSAVNFGLLSDREQIAIIFAFAQMLNSLSFSIQIVIYSERLNISSYLNLLDKAEQAQVNPLLSRMIGNYKQFIQATIKENDVLDKKFFVVIPLSPLELGLTASKENLEQKIATVLLPRRDQVVRQLSRVGLKATQVTRRKLIEVFYDMYNGQFVENVAPYQNGTGQAIKPERIEVTLKEPKPITEAPKTVVNPPASASQTPLSTGQASGNHLFTVEELDEKI